jgi:hypothetical protein
MPPPGRESDGHRVSDALESTYPSHDPRRSTRRGDSLLSEPARIDARLGQRCEFAQLPRSAFRQPHPSNPPRHMHTPAMPPPCRDSDGHRVSDALESTYPSHDPRRSTRRGDSLLSEPARIDARLGQRCEFAQLPRSAFRQAHPSNPPRHMHTPATPPPCRESDGHRAPWHPKSKRAASERPAPDAMLR